MKVTRHLSVNIDYLLGMTDRKLNNMFPEYTAAETRQDLQERKDLGHRLIGSENCIGFDPVKGCPGHPELTNNNKETMAAAALKMIYNC